MMTSLSIDKVQNSQASIYRLDCHLRVYLQTLLVGLYTRERQLKIEMNDAEALKRDTDEDRSKPTEYTSQCITSLRSGN